MSKTGQISVGLRLTLCAAFAALAACSYAGGEASPAPKPIDVPALKREIAAHRGRVVVVNLWATWCDGCVAEFPDMVRAANADKAKGLDLLTIDFDDAPAVAKSAIPFLAKNHLTDGIFANRKGSQLEDAYPQFFEPNLPSDDAYGIPRTYIFDRHGKLVKALVGQTKFADFQKAFAAALARK